MARELDERQFAIDLANQTRPAALDPPKRKPAKPIVYAACDSGPCLGGRRLCLTPEACQISETEAERAVFRTALVAILIVALIVCALLGLRTWAS